MNLTRSISKIKNIGIKKIKEDLDKHEDLITLLEKTSKDQ